MLEIEKKRWSLLWQVKIGKYCLLEIAVTNCYHKYNTEEKVPHLNYFVNLVDSNVPIVDTLYGVSCTVHLKQIRDTFFNYLWV